MTTCPFAVGVMIAKGKTAKAPTRILINCCFVAETRTCRIVADCARVFFRVQK